MKQTLHNREKHILTSSELVSAKKLPCTKGEEDLLKESDKLNTNNE